MKVFKLTDMVKGWFVGNFEPSVIKTSLVEVAVKKYKKGEFEPIHYHKVATEITVIVSGEVVMNGQVYKEGQFLYIEPNLSTDFLALTDVVTTVVKLPGAVGDKYLG